MLIHVVQRRDSVWRIAQQYGVSAQSLAQVNQLPSSNLVPGQTLLIPVAVRFYVVMPGDTIYSIAAQYGLSVRELLAWNPRLQGTSLFYGDVLRLPRIPREPKLALGFLELIEPSVDRANVLAYGPYHTYLALFTYGMTETGVITPAQDEAALQALAQTRALPAVTFANWVTDHFSPDAVHALLADSVRRQQYISEALDIVASKGYKAVVIDFESLYPEDGQAFVEFLRELSARLRPLGIPSIVCVMPISGQSPQEEPVIRAYNYAAIAKNTDLVMLMSYNWSWPGGPPGPIAPLQKVDANIRYALSQMSRNKILVGLVRYGYDWVLPYQAGEETGTREVQAIVEMAMQSQIDIQFDEKSLTPWLTYWDAQGREHVVWFEDARSLQLKLQLIQKYRLAGVAVWQLSQRFPQFTPLIRDNFRIQR